MPRLRWSIDLHRHFVYVVEKLGGKRRATPKKIWKLMDERTLTISHVKSHLQMYRNKKHEGSVQEKRARRHMGWRQSQHYLQLYEGIRAATWFIPNQRRLQWDINDNRTEFLKPFNNTMEVSCKSLFQSSRVGLNEIENKNIVIHADDVAVASNGVNDPLNSTEKLSLELTLGLKY